MMPRGRFLPVSAGLVLLFALGLGAACRGRQEPREPMGVLPTATTTAEPLWVPFVIRAGAGVERDPREVHLVEVRRLTDDGRSGRAAWHPNGRSIVFQRWDEEHCAHLVRMDLGSGEEDDVSPAGGCAFHPTFLDGALVFAFGRDGGCRGTSWFPEASEPAAPCVLRQAETLLTDHAGYDAEPFGARGALWFTSDRAGDLEIHRLEGREVVRVTSSPGYDGGATLSPDGSKLAWHARITETSEPSGAGGAAGRNAETSEAWRIMMAGASGQHPQVVVDRLGIHLHPAFLADSRRLLFASSLDAADPAKPELDLYLVDPDGPATADGRPRFERVTFAAGDDAEPRPSPDGDWLLFTSSRGGSSEVRDLYAARVRWTE